MVGGERAGRLRCQGDSGASCTGCTTFADQEENRGRCPSYLQHVHCPHHSTGPSSLKVQPPKSVDIISCQCLIIVCLSWQIVKVLTLYTPVIEFEERVSTTFITTIKVSSWKVLLVWAGVQSSFILFYTITLYLCSVTLFSTYFTTSPFFIF